MAAAQWQQQESIGAAEEAAALAAAAKATAAGGVALHMILSILLPYIRAINTRNSSLRRSNFEFSAAKATFSIEYFQRDLQAEGKRLLQ